MERDFIMLVDDEAKIRRLVASNLQDYGFDVVTAATGEVALKSFKEALPKPDLVLLDVMMPGMDGFECARQMRLIDPAVPVIFLSARNERSFKMQGFGVGADDYITKPFSVEELAARIHAVLRRSKAAGGAVSHKELVNGPLRLDLSARRAWVGECEMRLARTEFQLLWVLMKQPGAVVPHEQLLASVWGDAHRGEVQYLRVACARIRRKLEEAGLEGGVISAYSGVGYILRDLVADPL